MLFPQALHEGLRSGAVTLTVRRWTRPQAKVGYRLSPRGEAYLRLRRQP